MRVSYFAGVLALLGLLAAPFVATADPPAGGPPGGGPPEGGPPPGDRPRFDPERFFERFDEDGNGTLSEAEAPERLKARFAEVDDNGDGEISLEEFKANRPPRPQGPPPADGAGGPPPRDGEGGPPPRGGGRQFAERVFERHDANEDGLLSKDEVPEQFQEGFEKVLEIGDSDGDGAVTLDEYTEAMGELFRQRRAAGEDSPGDARPPRRPRGDGPPEGGPPPGPPNPEQIMQHLLDRADTDGDGQISREEALAKAGERFDRVDTNKDGMIDEAELQQAVDHFAERMHHHREHGGDRHGGPHRHGHGHDGPPPERD